MSGRDLGDVLDILAGYCGPGEPMRALVLGASGRGKSTLVAGLADAARSGEVLEGLVVVCADPGRPGFGPPGAVTRAVRSEGGWAIEAIEGLATLDPMGYRLPWARAVARLCRDVEPGRPLLVDAPGVVRGGRALEEMYLALAEACAARSALVLLGEDEEAPAPLAALAAIGVEVHEMDAHPEARAPGRGARRTERTASWDDFVEEAVTCRLARRGRAVLGEPPPVGRPAAWRGLQLVALSEGGRTLALGEIVEADAVEIRARMRGAGGALSAAEIEARARARLVRDARRIDGKLRTETGDAEQEDPRGAGRRGGGSLFTPRERPQVAMDLGPGPMLRGASMRVGLVGGLFDDPMALMRMDHRRRCLFFDLGEVREIPTRLVHQASDAFVTHTHLDHFGGFPELLRRRLGVEEPLRVFGPPGVERRVEAMIRAFHWDRIGDRGPAFLACAFDGERVRRASMRCGDDAMVDAGEEAAADGVLVDEPRMRVRATVLDHGIPVLAYAVEEPERFDVRGDVLRERGWTPGAWLGQLKTLAARRRLDEAVTVPAGGGEELERSVGTLVDELLIARPGQKIVYATDFADTPDNRRAIVELARGAHLLICEASFLVEDADQAARTGHLTTRACAEIAREADVGLLLPFHASSRYEDRPEQIFAEILEIFERTYVPAALEERLY